MSYKGTSRRGLIRPGRDVADIRLFVRSEAELQTVLDLTPPVFAGLGHIPEVVPDRGVHDTSATKGLRLRPCRAS